MDEQKQTRIKWLTVTNHSSVLAMKAITKSPARKGAHIDAGLIPRAQHIAHPYGSRTGPKCSISGGPQCPGEAQHPVYRD